MEQRNTCIAGLRLEVASGHIRIFVEQAGREYLIVDEDMMLQSLTMTALRIDHLIAAIDDAAYLAHVGAGDVRGAL